MNLGLKSGTNNVHGTAYYFTRNSAVDARNFFDVVPSPVSALIMHQFGASLGGPIKKNKWFYFVNYEGIRDKVGNPGVYDSPVTVSLASRIGGIADSQGNPLSLPTAFPMRSPIASRIHPTLRFAIAGFAWWVLQSRRRINSPYPFVSG
jgi:hypothetical protein